MGFEIDVHPKYIQVFFIIWLFWRSQETILYKLCHTQYHYTSQSLFKSEEDCWPGPVMNLKLYSNPTTWRLESKAESTSCLEDTQNIFLKEGIFLSLHRCWLHYCKFVFARLLVKYSCCEETFSSTSLELYCWGCDHENFPFQINFDKMSF